jgi:hypothetical protein
MIDVDVLALTRAIERLESTLHGKNEAIESLAQSMESIAESLALLAERMPAPKKRTRLKAVNGVVKA